MIYSQKTDRPRIASERDKNKYKIKLRSIKNDFSYTSLA